MGTEIPIFYAPPPNICVLVNVSNRRKFEVGFPSLNLWVKIRRWEWKIPAARLVLSSGAGLLQATLSTRGAGGKYRGADRLDHCSVAQRLASFPSGRWAGLDSDTCSARLGPHVMLCHGTVAIALAVSRAVHHCSCLWRLFDCWLSPSLERKVRRLDPLCREQAWSKGRGMLADRVTEDE